MTSHTGRLYGLAIALVVFFLAWTTVAAHPWRAAATDPRLKALAVREARLRRKGALVKQVVAQRWATYRARLKARRVRIAAVTRNAAGASSAPSATSSAVRVVNLPPLTVTRTS